MSEIPTMPLGGPIPEPGRCSWGFHKWSVWSEPTKQPVGLVGLQPPPGMNFFETKQKRCCLLCHRVESKTLP